MKEIHSAVIEIKVMAGTNYIITQHIGQHSANCRFCKLPLTQGGLTHPKLNSGNLLFAVFKHFAYKCLAFTLFVLEHQHSDGDVLSTKIDLQQQA